MQECRICGDFCYDLACFKCTSGFVHYGVKCAMCFDSFCVCVHKYIALFEYNSCKSEILRLKYCKEYMIADVFATLSSLVIESGLIWTCVPTTYKKLAERGYNTSLVLCRSFATLYDGVIDPFIFEMSEGEFERNNDKTHRAIKNLNFRVNSSAIDGIRGKQIVIVDDVICTGSTLQKLIGLLSEYTDKPVICLCIAKK